MPRQFAFRGERLAFTTGIVALAGLAIVLLLVFQASVTALIPLYTLGVFVAFTLSQTGMVAPLVAAPRAGLARAAWPINGARRRHHRGDRVIVAATKFLSGAWLVIVAGPAPDPAPARHPAPLPERSRAARRSSNRARQGGGRGADRDRACRAPGSPGAPGDRLRQLDQPPRGGSPRHQRPGHRRGAARALAGAGRASTELVVVESPYRALIGPLLATWTRSASQAPNRPIVVVLTEVVPRHWWENLLHNQTALRLKLRLFFRRNTIVADVPYHLD